MATPISSQALLRAPKVLLHDHLDGGLRPATVVELAAETGYPDLPSTDADGLGTWFRDAADSGSLGATWRRSRTPSGSCRPSRGSSRAARMWFNRR